MVKSQSGKCKNTAFSSVANRPLCAIQCKGQDDNKQG
uniref:Uncharacterized protein n=1 Tax=Nelumbo nucifera TaxID=4432 RepID=A0A823A0W1_NELNU|nr:TPA_asm: hypothetical protein HUJ06_018603 [Nelumbo nucifera]